MTVSRPTPTPAPAKARPLPLRLRLAGIYGLFAAFALALALAFGYGFYERGAYRNMDGILTVFANQTAAMIDQPGGPGLDSPIPGLPLTQRLLDGAGRVLREGRPPPPDGAVTWATPAHAPWVDLLPQVAAVPQDFRGYGLLEWGGQRWRVFAQPVSGGRVLEAYYGLAATERALGAVRRNFALAGLVGALLVFLGGFALTGPTLKPLARLADAARAAVGAEGPGQADELDRLAEAVRRGVSSLRSERERLDLALASARMGWWEWDLVAETHRWSPGFERLMGLGPGEFVGGPEAFLERIHPDDRARVEGYVWSHRRGEARPPEYEYRVADRAGGWRWISCRSRVYHEGGRPSRVVGVDTDITERKEAEGRLAESERRYRALAESQKRFVADAAHELRAPLTAIQGNLELLTRFAGMPEAERQEAVREVSTEAQRLGRLVGDMLALARGDSGAGLELEPTRLDSAVARALATARSLAGGRVAVEAGPLPEVWVCGDPDRLTQLALQLLENAVKYTPAGGRVGLELSAGGGWAELRVEDNGIGISAEDLPRVFERFFRADRARSRAGGGTGLGLSIAQWIVEQHGGHIRLESELGRGTLAVVRLPLGQPA